MTKNGFDNSQPVHIWHVIDDNGNEHFYLIDGYTRLAALKELGMETVPYYEHKFADFEEAFSYGLGLQVNRRNLSGPELLKNVSKLLGTDFVQNAEGKKSEVIADVLGVSDRTVEKAIAVSEEADEETLAKVESGELSVNKAYKQTKEKARKAKADDEELSDSLSDNTGNPSGLNFNHSDGIERPTYKLSPEEDNERTRERKTANELGFIDGFLQAADYIFSQLRNNVFMEEIEKEISKAKKDYEKLSALVSISEESVIDEDDDGPELDFGDKSENTSAEQDQDLTDDDSDDAFNLGLD